MPSANRNHTVWRSTRSRIRGPRGGGADTRDAASGYCVRLTALITALREAVTMLASTPTPQ